ncbi:MAG: FAD-binding oxidoreductase [Planctomycetota bacterium]|jgi:FAD/FMN-containing dehydrogenase
MSDVTPQALQELQASIRGLVSEPGSPAYEEARTIWNGMIDRRPSAAARCVGAADVIACMRFVRKHDLPFTIRGGGHNIAGLAVADGAFMIDLSGMRGVYVDPAARSARAQPGATLGDIDRETQLHGLAAVLGFVSNTGATGLTLGGGFGYMTREYGWTCDNVRSMEMVTADGRLVRASANENEDLFWGLRGGGGNFGIVTGVDYDLYPVGPEIVGGVIAWRGEDAPDVLEMYRELTANAPPQLTCAALMRKAPPAPWLPSEIHGELIAGIVLCHTGPLEQAERDIAAIKAHGTPVGDVVQRRPYTSQQSILDATQPNGRRYYWKSEYLPEISPDLLSVYQEHGEKITSPHSAVILFPIGGALNDLPLEHCPMGNRDARYVLNITGSWESPDEDGVHIGWAREAWSDMRRFSTGGTYINFLTEEEGDDRIRAAYGANYDRLVDVKTKWDPENVFCRNKNIAPR